MGQRECEFQGPTFDLPTEVVAEVTDDWVECVSKISDLRTTFARMTLVCGLPRGVNPDDPRVVQLVARIREANQTP